MGGAEMRYWDVDECRWVTMPAVAEALPEQSSAPDEERVAPVVEVDVRSG